jgi:hypothetical protein
LSFVTLIRNHGSKIWMLPAEYTFRIFSHFIVRNNSREYSCFNAVYRTCVSIKIRTSVRGQVFTKCV